VAEDKPKVYDASGEELGRTRFRQLRFQAAAQRAFGHDGLLELGIVGGHSEVVERAGIPYAARDDTVVKVGARAILDTVDNRFWPSGGLRVDGRAEQSVTGLGASVSYWRASLRLDGYARVAKSWMVEGHLFGGGAGEEAPVYDHHRVGGPVLVPGRSRDEMWGPWAGAASLGLVFRPTTRFKVTLRGGVGNAWADQKAIRLDDLRAGATLGIARSTVVGPVALDVGVGASDLKVYVSLGFQ
jgi:outer membrane translocation and assembly module TamA